MASVEQSIDVAVPVRTAYDQWTQFEEFPAFMRGVKRIEQRTPTQMHWVTSIAGVDREFDTEISEQIPDDRIAWHAVEGPEQAGVVTFHRLDDLRTRIMVQMEFAPQGVLEQVGDKLGFVSSRIEGDLKNFKRFIEDRGEETGAWRGRVEPPTQLAPDEVRARRQEEADAGPEPAPPLGPYATQAPGYPPAPAGEQPSGAPHPGPAPGPPHAAADDVTSPEEEAIAAEGAGGLGDPGNVDEALDDRDRPAH